MALTGYTSGGDLDSKESTTTADALFGGRVLLDQPTRGAGYRTNVDALLLAHFAAQPRRKVRTAFDLGSGVGAVGLSLLYLGICERCVLVEIDESAAATAIRNAIRNGWGETAEVVCGDVLRVGRERAGEAQLVVCNPPYFEPGRGRPSKDARVSRARTGSLAHFVEAARELAGRRARVCFVYPSTEMATLFATLRAAGLEPKRARMVHSSPRTPARVVLVEAQHGKKGGLVWMPPLFERDDGGYTGEMRALLAH
jgi:tRNA1Val (adenine37-N6)-methyltransferase